MLHPVYVNLLHIQILTLEFRNILRLLFRIDPQKPTEHGTTQNVSIDPSNLFDENISQIRGEIFI